jgi:hypothetical protein
MASKFDFLRKLLPPETFNVLNSPTKDELTLGGQGELPFPGGETDFLPAEVVREDRAGSIFDQWFPEEPQQPQGLGAAYAPPAAPVQGTFMNDLEAGLPTPVFNNRQTSATRGGVPAPVQQTPLWNAPPASDAIATPYAPPKDFSALDVDPEVVPKGAFPERIPYSNVSPDQIDRVSPTEFEAVYGESDLPPVEMPPGTKDMSWWAQSDSLERQGMERSHWTPKPRPLSIAQPGLEQAVEYGQPVEALPEGRYEEYSIPEERGGGRGAKFVPQDPANAFKQPEQPAPGIPIPSLSKLTRKVEDLTGEGVAQPLMPTRVPQTAAVKEAIDDLEARGISDRAQMETIWDRVSGAEGENAEAKFLEVIDGVNDHYNGLRATYQREDGGYDIEPFTQALPFAKSGAEDWSAIPHEQRVRNAQQFLSQARKFIPGIDGEGYGERTLVEDTGFNAAQLGEGGYSPIAQGLRGSELDADFRQDANPKGKAFDKKENYLIGQEPLRAIDKRPDLTTDQVQNLITGVSDVGLVPRGKLQPGVNRVQGSGEPAEIDVLKVVPLRGNPGYLKAVAARVGIPLRTLQTMVDGGMELDIIQTRSPKKPGGDLPSEARWRAPEDLAFWKGDSGEAQRKKFEADSTTTEKLLQQPGSRIVRADRGVGKKVLAVVRHKGAPHAVVDAGSGKKILKPLQRGPKGELLYEGKAIPANVLEKDPLRGRALEAGVVGGAPRMDDHIPGKVIPKAELPERLASETYAGKQPVVVEGVQLSPTPVRSDVSKVKFVQAPKGHDPAKAELTVLFNTRQPSKLNPEGLPADAPGTPKTLANPTAEELAEVLSRSNIGRVVIQIEGMGRKGPDAATADRARAILKAVKSGKALALAGAGAAVLAGSEEEAEAAPRLGEAFGRTKALRETKPPITHQPSVRETLRTTQIDQFDPIYRTIREKLGLDDTPTREVIQTAHGGGGGEAEIDYEPIRLHQEKFGEDFDKLLTTKQGLRQWDVVARKRDQFLAEARTAEINGNDRLAKKKIELAKAIDDRMAKNEVWEQGLTKEDLAAHLDELRAADPGKFAKLDEMYGAGLIPDKSYKEYKDRGLDHVPAWKTPYVVNEDGTVTYTGGKRFETHSTSIEGTTEQLLEEVMGSPGVSKSPFDNAARFLTEGTAEIARTKIAQQVIKVLEPSGMAKRVPAPDGKTAELGNSFYTILEKGKPVTYELPTYLTETLLMTDKDFTRKFLANVPGLKGVSWMRAIPEAAMTTANIGFAGTQATIIDPISALVQVEWADNGVLKNLIPFYTAWAKHLTQGFKREWIGGESSDVRKRAGKAGALYSGASSLVANPRDVQGNKGFDDMKEALRQKKYGNAIQEGVSATLHPLTKKLMQPFEEATKLAVFDRLTSRGMDDTKAAYQTRKYGGSPDWGQTGSSDAALRTMVTFGRPALLGIEAGLMAAKRNPKKLATVMAGSLAFEAGRQFFNEQTASELGVSLEELDARFSEYDKDNTVVFYIPPSVAKRFGGAEQEVLSNGIERPYAIKHTIPPVLRMWMSPFKGLAKAMRTGNPIEAPLAIADEMIPGTVPLKGDDLMGTGVRRAGASLPAPLRWGAEQVMDKQFFTGAPIVGSRLSGLPDEEQFSDSTQPFYKEAGKAFGMSPKRLEHTGKTFLPGVLETPIQLLNSLTPKKEGVAPVEKSISETLADIPFFGPTVARRFLPQRYEEELGDYQDDFYNLSEKTKAAAGAINRFEKGIGSDPSKLVEALGGWNPEVARMVRTLSEISTQKKQIVNAPGMTGREKRDALKALTDQHRELLKGFLSDPAKQDLLDGKVPR